MLLGLLKKCSSLGGLLVQVGQVRDELDRVDDFLVIEQHASDLASSVAIHLLDARVDVVADFLAALGRVHRH